MSKKNNIGLFDATFENLARALIQISRYRQFLQSAETGTCPDWLELLTLATRRQGSHVYLAHGLDNYASEFHDRLPYLEGEECFRFIKCNFF